MYLTRATYRWGGMEGEEEEGRLRRDGEILLRKVSRTFFVHGLYTVEYDIYIYTGVPLFPGVSLLTRNRLVYTEVKVLFSPFRLTLGFWSLLHDDMSCNATTRKKINKYLTRYYCVAQSAKTMLSNIF